MLFSSVLFLFYFLPLLLLVYYLSPARLRNVVLLVASLFFYAWGAPVFAGILLGTLAVNFYLTKQLAKRISDKKIWLIASLFLHLGLLGYCKYANFFVENFNVVLAQVGYLPMEWAAVVLPLGISFFTFQSISYTVDVYRRVKPPLDSLLDYLLYILLFPQLIAGPIVRYAEIANQLNPLKRTRHSDDVLFGFYRFTLGLAKKVIIADVLALEVDRIFLLGENGGDPSTPLAWIGVIAYSFQLYFDFSGYTDMAIGLGRMFGFRFPENFNYPYIANSVTNFWQRWHMTFTRWMRDYLYIPLGGNRGSRTKLYFNLGLVFVLSGLWHGADWVFIIWGLWHGVLLIVERWFRGSKLRLPTPLQVLLTYLFVLLGWVWFRSPDVSTAVHYLQVMFAATTSTPSQDWAILPHSFWVTLCLAAVLSFGTILPSGLRFAEWLHALPQTKLGVIAKFLLLLLLFILSSTYVVSSDFSPFIYFRF